MSEQLERVRLSGGRRAIIGPSEWLDDWWAGWCKDQSCQFEGPWEDMAELAAKVLAHPNTAKVAPHLYRPDLAGEETR